MRARAAAATVLLVAAITGAVLALGSGSGPRQAPPARPPAPPAPALPAPAAQAFGVNVNLLFNDFSYTPAQIGAQLQAVRATGAALARSDALWEATEPKAPIDGHHSYAWAFDDQVAGALAAQELTWLPILDYTAPWAQSIAGQDHSPPRTDGDYAAYAAAFAARYGPGGSFWREHPQLTPQPVTTIEIWNEPDNGEFWAPSPDPGGYADLYLAARVAIDAVNPGIRVVIGGLTRPTEFLPAMLQARPALRGHIDGVAIHPYGVPAVVVSKIRAARATLVSLGMAAVPLYVTEFGWTTQPPRAIAYVNAHRRPGFILTTLTQLGHLQCGVAAGVLYTWVTPQHNPADGQDWYGIADPSAAGAATADVAAFSAGLRAATQPLPRAAPVPCSG